MSIPRKIELVHTDEEFEELTQELTSWRKAYVEIMDIHTKKNDEYWREMEWLKDLFAQQWLSGDHKVLLWAMRCIIRQLRYDLSQPVHIWLGELANKTGLSENTIKRLTSQLHETGLIVKDTRGSGKGQKTWFNLDESIHISAKDMVIPATKRNHGGERIRCKKCKGENLQAIGYKCLDCGCQWTL